MRLDIVEPPPASAKVSEQSSPFELVDWMLQRFEGQRMLMTTAFGMEGCALVDIIAQRASRFTVAYIDTHFFFPETLELCDRLAKRYPQIRFERHQTDLTPAKQAEEHGDKLWERNPDLCCKIRKVDPMVRLMADVDVWVTGIRRTQSANRAQARVVEWDWQYEVVKVNPLVNWERKDIWEYVRTHDVPYNPLHEQGYPSIGCTNCTKPVPGATIDTYSREGRWNGKEKLECGLHGYGI